ncbi:Uncharacterised protein [Trueperella bialowiezensis]|uniref:Uncharacterized protein n=1 Tax=Trueperella bialowiezensis TaxID=312285 RepID=A0A448PDZ7_9ACTO|nr:Uncharacterised protein [Trueperella bialowiezensis]
MKIFLSMLGVPFVFALALFGGVVVLDEVYEEMSVD